MSDGGIRELELGLEQYQQGNYVFAYMSFIQAAQEGNANAMNNLSVLHYNGTGTIKSSEKAFYWMKKAAEHGCANSYYPLAAKYFNGDGTSKDIVQAEYWAKKAIEVQSNVQNAQKILDLVAKAKGQSQNLQPQRIQQQKANNVLKVNVRKPKAYPKQVVYDFMEGKRLYDQKKYAEALLLLENAGKGGHIQALRLIGEAYLNGYGVEQNVPFAVQFLRAAAYRGDQTAQKMIALRIINSDEAFLWKAYAKDQNMPGAHDEYVKEVTKERNKPIDTDAPFDESEAMCGAAEYWKKHLRNPKQSVTVGRSTFPIVGLANDYMKKAMHFGNLDAACAYGDYIRSSTVPEFQKKYIDYYRIAAYCGHSYGMFCVGKYYDSIDQNIANECYKQAAQWKFSHAIRVCNERGIKY